MLLDFYHLTANNFNNIILFNLLWVTKHKNPKSGTPDIKRLGTTGLGNANIWRQAMCKDNVDNGSKHVKS